MNHIKNAGLESETVACEQPKSTPNDPDTLPKIVDDEYGNDIDPQFQFGVLPTVDQLELAESVGRHPASGLASTKGKIALTGATATGSSKSKKTKVADKPQPGKVVNIKKSRK